MLSVRVLALLAGPPVAGILLTGLLHGRAGFRDLLSRMMRWRVGARWYAVALLTAPLVMTAVLLALSLISPSSSRAYSPPATGLRSAVRYRVGLIGGAFLEELGWTGFAVPTLLRRATVSLARGSSWACCGERGTSLRYFWVSSVPPERSRWPSSLPATLHFS